MGLPWRLLMLRASFSLSIILACIAGGRWARVSWRARLLPVPGMGGSMTLPPGRPWLILRWGLSAILLKLKGMIYLLRYISFLSETSRTPGHTKGVVISPPYIASISFQNLSLC